MHFGNQNFISCQSFFMSNDARAVSSMRKQAARRHATVLRLALRLREHALQRRPPRRASSCVYEHTVNLPFTHATLMRVLVFLFRARRYAAVAQTALPLWDTMKLCAAYYTDADLTSQFRPHTNSKCAWDFRLACTFVAWILTICVYFRLCAQRPCARPPSARTFHWKPPRPRGLRAMVRSARSDRPRSRCRYRERRYAVLQLLVFGE